MTPASPSTATRFRPGRLQEVPPLPGWFKFLVAFCATLGLVVVGVAIWAVVTLVQHVAR